MHLGDFGDHRLTGQRMPHEQHDPLVPGDAVPAVGGLAHLDLEAINALNIALQKFDGTVLLVTHDQDLAEEVGTRVWDFDHGTIEDFKGAYEEYEASVA